jgi:myotubularin-related protein 3/4
MLLNAACHIVKVMDKDCQPVVVHCSDGWDRTPQLTSLAQIMLDPFYRTVPGFTILVEREWLSFGHKFGSRCGHRVDNHDSSERSPIFLQWLDCIHQLLVQFPTAFEFNEVFLVKLAIHTYSCLYGTFLYNCAQEHGQQMDVTLSVWSLLSHNNQHILNFLYEDMKQVSKECTMVESWYIVYICLGFGS